MTRLLVILVLATAVFSKPWNSGVRDYEKDDNGIERSLRDGCRTRGGANQDLFRDTDTCCSLETKDEETILFWCTCSATICKAQTLKEFFAFASQKDQ